MQLPDFIMSLPALDLPIPEDVVETHAMRSDNRLTAFFIFHQDFELPPHSHKGQWGTILAGEAEFTIGGVVSTFRPGDSYDLPSGVEHSGRFKAGTIAFDVWEEPDRYQLKS